MRIHGALTLTLALMLVAPLTPGALPLPEPPGGVPAPQVERVVSSTHHVMSDDGARLAVTLWYDDSAAASPRPVVLAAHGWTHDRSTMEPAAHWLVTQGHIVAAWDARGFGDSGGAVGLNGPDEWRDVTAIIDWLAARAGDEPRILLDAPGNPRIGMIGASYGGAIQLLAAAHDERIDAIVPDITWNDLTHSVMPNGVLKRAWQHLLQLSGALDDTATAAPPQEQGIDARLATWYQEAQHTGRLPAEAQHALDVRSPAMYHETIHAHVLVLHGWRDTLFWPDEAAAIHQALAGRSHAETHLVFHAAAHGSALPPDEAAVVGEIIARFLARHLLDAESEALPPVLYHSSTEQAWFEASAWPPPQAVRHAFPLASSGGQTAQLDPAQPAVLISTGVSGPLRLAGAPVVELHVEATSGEAFLFVALVTTDPSQTEARVLHDQVTPYRIESTPGERVQITLALPTLAHTLREDESLWLRVATSDPAYLTAPPSGNLGLHLAEAHLELGVLPPTGTTTIAHVEAETTETPAAAVALVIALVVLVVTAARWTRRR